MAKKGRSHGEVSWGNAKKVCRLNTRQVEMARRLGMNPIKLGLRPTPQQRWKRPVGAFIEECYEKRFGSDAPDRDSHVLEPSSRTPRRDQERLRDADWQLGDLVCYLINLTNDLQKWQGQTTVDRELLLQVSEELREVAQALDIGAAISPMPAIPVPPSPTRRARPQRDDLESAFNDDIPF